MSERFRIAVVGPLNIDLFVRGSAPIEREALNAWVGQAAVELVVAGSIGYTVQALARLGNDVEVHSTIGTDAFGAFIRDGLLARGLDVGQLATAQGQTAMGIYMLLFGGQKRPLAIRMPDFEPWPDPAFVLRADAPRPDLLHSGGLLHFPAMWHRGLPSTFQEARAAGVLTSIDPQFPLEDTPAPWLPHVADVLTHADVLLCDEGEAMMLFQVGSAEAALTPALASGPHIVAIKRGARGALVSDGDTTIEQPAAPVPQALVREAVGAGDAFDAGFLDALLRRAPLAEAARLATATAALSLSGRGGAEGIADRAAVMAALARVPPARILPARISLARTSPA